MLIYILKVCINVDIRCIVRQSCRRSLSSAAGIARSTRISKASRLLKFDSPTQRSELSRSFLPRVEYRFSRSFSWRRIPSCRLDAAANKKGRKVIEKVEQPRSLACTCRGACWFYRRARPRRGGTATNISTCFFCERYLYLS